METKHREISIATYKYKRAFTAFIQLDYNILTTFEQFRQQQKLLLKEVSNTTMLYTIKEFVHIRYIMKYRKLKKITNMTEK